MGKTERISKEYARKAHLSSGVNPNLIESVIYEALTEFTSLPVSPNVSKVEDWHEVHNKYRMYCLNAKQNYFDNFTFFDWAKQHYSIPVSTTEPDGYIVGKSYFKSIEDVNKFVHPNDVHKAIPVYFTPSERKTSEREIDRISKELYPTKVGDIINKMNTTKAFHWALGAKWMLSKYPSSPPMEKQISEVEAVGCNKKFIDGNSYTPTYVDLLRELSRWLEYEKVGRNENQCMHINLFQKRLAEIVLNLATPKQEDAVK